EEIEAIGDGLGPLFNARSCAECHQHPTTGAISQVRELRAGHRDASGNFVPASVTIGDGSMTVANRSLINLRAICPGHYTVQIDGEDVDFNFPDTQGQEHVPDNEDVRTFRTSLNTLGDGFVEAIADETLRRIATEQCESSQGTICGQAIDVPVLEGENGAT